METSWSDWSRFGVKELSNVPEKEGVYQFRCVDGIVCIMNKGKVAQIGTPLEVYRNPADTFVASFLGSPPVNLLPGIVSMVDGPVVNVGGNTLILKRYDPGILADYVNRPIIFGIRPENIYITPPLRGNANFGKIPAKVTAVSPLGSETLLILRFDGIKKEVIAKIGSENNPKINDRLLIFLDLDAADLYDADTTKAINSRQHYEEKIGCRF